MTIKRILSVLAISLIVVLSIVFKEEPQKVNFIDNKDEYIYKMNMNPNGFVILQLTDIHWSTGTDIESSKTYIKKVIEEANQHSKKNGHEAKVDLIEITGDIFMLASSRTVKIFIDFIESFNIPYAVTWGNHDREGKYNPNWISKQFLKAEHSVYIEVDNDDVSGRSNYVIDLVDATSKSVKYQLFHLDSGASYRDGALDLGLDYDYIRENQLNWLEAMHEENTPSLCFYHIAQSDNDILLNSIQSGATNKNKFFYLENFCSSSKSTSVDEVFSRCDIRAAFMGHAHAVDWTVTSNNNVIYSLGVKTGTELYSYTSSFIEPIDDNGYGYYGTHENDYTGYISVIGASLVTLPYYENYQDVGFLDTDSIQMVLEHLYYNEAKSKNDNDLIIWERY